MCPQVDEALEESEDRGPLPCLTPGSTACDWEEGWIGQPWGRKTPGNHGKTKECHLDDPSGGMYSKGSCCGAGGQEVKGGAEGNNLFGDFVCSADKHTLLHPHHHIIRPSHCQVEATLAG